MIPSHELASHWKFGLAAKAKSRTLSAVKRQVREPVVAGRVLAGSPASALVMTATGAVDAAACDRRLRWAAVSTCSGFRSVPVAATTYPAGTVRSTSNRPYSR